MKVFHTRFQATIKRWGSVALMISLLAGSISVISYAQAPRQEGVFRIDVKGGGASKRDSNAQNYATPSSATISNSASDPVNSSYLKQILKQSEDTSNQIYPEWFKLKLNNTLITDSTTWQPSLENGQEIEDGSRLEYELRVRFNVSEGGLSEGDAVAWNLGTMEGLDQPGEIWEPILLGMHEIGFATVTYNSDNEVILYTEFYEEITMSPVVTITYTYDFGFVPVHEITEIELGIPGVNGPTTAFLLPPAGEESSCTEPSETETSEIGTSEAETSETETSEAETSATETSETETSAAETSGTEATTESSTQTTKPQESESTVETTVPVETTTAAATKGSGSGGDSDYVSRQTTAAVTTSAATIAETTLAAESTVAETTPAETTAAATAATTEATKAVGDKARGDKNGQDSVKVEAEDDISQAVSIAASVVSKNGTTGQAQPGEVLTYRISVSNNGTETANNIRVRDYLPEHTSFVSAGNEGVYGISDGNQRVTWEIPELQPGAELELVLRVRVFACTPENYRINSRFYWQADDENSVNAKEDPTVIGTFADVFVR